MTVLYQGFPRVLERSALRPGRWCVAADGLRPVVCLVTDVESKGDLLAVTFGAPKVETIEIDAMRLADLIGPFGTVEDELVFAPGLNDQRPTLVAPSRRPVRHGSLVRLRSGDMGIGCASPEGGLMVVSLASGMRSEGFELVFERWSLALRRGGVESLVGYFRPAPRLTEDRRRV